MMKQIYSLLNLAVVVVVVLNIANAAMTIFDYAAHPEVYDMMSAPWYLGIQISVFFSILLLIPILIARFFIGRKLRKDEK